PLHAERLLEPLIPLVLQIEVERVAVGLVNVRGENWLHSDNTAGQRAEGLGPWDRQPYMLPLHLQMTTRKRGDSTSLQIIHQFRTRFRGRALVPVFVVDHHDRRAVAGAEA